MGTHKSPQTIHLRIITVDVINVTVDDWITNTQGSTGIFKRNMSVKIMWYILDIDS